MLARLERTTGIPRRLAAGLVIFALQLWQAGTVLAQRALVVTPRPSTPADQRDQLDLIHRREGEAVLALADAAMTGKSVPLDFAVFWQNEFVKAQRGTFVPFTLTVDASQLSRPSALVYVRALKRKAEPERQERSAEPERQKAADAPREEAASYPVDAIFPVELHRGADSRARISRGFSVLPGDYDVLVVMRERVDPASPRSKPKAAVVRQSISVPDFWSSELTTSSVIVADRLSLLSEPVAADQIAERPYAIGRNEITPSIDRTFRRDEELIVVFLVYNPMVTTERHFDVKVEYHFFRKASAASTAESSMPHPPARAGEAYFNHTDPQRFNPALMGTAFDPARGEPVMAGQVVPLNGFLEGEYRLAVQVTDLLSGQSISRDVFFKVGS
jgi:hypothetical protein